MEIKQQLLELKDKQKFVFPEWDEEGAHPSSIRRDKILNGEVNRFIDFLIPVLDQPEASQIPVIQQWFNDWEVDMFHKDDLELIADVMLLTLEMAGIKDDDILI